MPDDAVNLDIGVTLPSEQVIDTVARGIDKYADSVERAAASLEKGIGPNERLIAAQRQLNNELNQGGVSYARYRDLLNDVSQAERRVENVNSRLNPTVAPPPVLRPSGPYGRLQEAQDRLNRVLADPSGVSDAQLKDLRFSVSQAQDAADRADKKNAPRNFAQDIAGVLYSSRIGSDSGLMPLVGKGLDAVSGGEGMALLSNPYVLAGVAALKLGDELYKTAQRAAEAGNRFSEVGFMTGGSGSENAQIQVFSDAIGKNLAPLAQQLNDRITTDPVARAIAAQNGIYNQPGAFGNQDFASNLLHVVEVLRKISDNQERLRVARALGVEEALPLTNLSNASFQGLKQDAAIRSRIMDKDFLQQSQDLTTETQRASKGVEDLSNAIGKKFLPVVTPLSRFLGNASEGAAGSVNDMSVPELFARAVDLVSNPFIAVPRLIAQGNRNFAKTGDAPGNSSSETKENTEALTELTKTIASQRARGAMPGSVGGEQIARLAEAGALQFAAI